MEREHRRQVTVTIDDGGPVTYSVDGTSTSDTTIKEILVAALAQANRDG